MFLIISLGLLAVFQVVVTGGVSISSTSAGSSTTACGVSTSTANCGNVGDPYEGNAPPSSPTAVSSCSTLSTTNGKYKLTTNIGADATATCLTLSAKGMNVDLGGFIITGQVSATSAIDGTILYNGIINCNWTENGSNAGCVRFDWSPVTLTAQTRIHHLTVTNSNTGNSRAIHSDMAGATYSGGGKELVIDHVTSSSPATGVIARWAIINTNGAAGGFDANSNLLTCVAGTVACQGVVCYGSKNCTIHNNNFNMVTNTTGQETGRATVCDTQGGPAASGDNCLVQYNYMNANNNRAYRNRLAYHASFINNIVDNIASGSTGALHVGDPDSGDEANADLLISANTFTVGNGIVFWGRNISGATAQNNTLVCAGSGCTSGIFANAATPIGGSVTSILTIKNNPTAASIGMTTPNNVAASAEIDNCNSGTVTGPGTAVTISPCT